MSLDRRIRDGLGRSADIGGSDIDVALDGIIRGARRRQMIRRLVAAAIVLGVVLVAIVLLPKAIDILRGERRVPADLGGKELLLRVPGFGFGFSEDGRLFVRALDSSGAIYDPNSAAPSQSVSGRDDGVIAFSPDGSRFVTARGDPSCCHTYLYDSASGRLLLHIRDACCFAAFSRDGRYLAVPRRGTSVIDTATGEIVSHFQPWGAMAFSPDGERLVVSPFPDEAGKGIIAYIYDVGVGRSQPVQSLRATPGGGNVPDVYVDWGPWSPDGSMVAIPTSAGDVIVWDAQTGDQLFDIARPDARFVSSAFSPDGLVATGARNGTVFVWDLSGDAPVQVRAIDAYDRRVDHLVFGPSSDLMTASWHRPTKIWRVSANR
jgi:WD40 repeat protein